MLCLVLVSVLLLKSLVLVWTTTLVFTGKTLTFTVTVQALTLAAKYLTTALVVKSLLKSLALEVNCSYHLCEWYGDGACNTAEENSIVFSLS